MKSIIKLLLVMWMGLSYPLKAQVEDEKLQYIHEKVQVYYVPNPNESEDNYFVDANSVYSATISVDETGGFEENEDSRKAWHLIGKLFIDPAEGGDKKLQELTYYTLKMTDQPVRIAILNDNDTPVNELGQENWRPTLDNNGYVWPQAEYDDIDNVFLIMMGTHHMNQQALSWTIGHFLHSLMHTRDHPRMGIHEYYPYDDFGRYESKSKSFTMNALPNMAEVYWESVTNMVNYLYDPTLFQRTFDWFKQNSPLVVPTQRDESNQDVAYQDWLYTRLSVESEGVNTKDDPRYKVFRLHDLSPMFSIHNEAVMGILLAQCAKYTGVENMFTIVGNTIPDALEDSYYTSSLMKKLITKMHETASEGNLYLLPIAYADYLTNYRIAEVEDFSAVFEDKVSREWIGDYFTIYRKKIRNLIPQERSGHTIRDFETITTILKQKAPYVKKAPTGEERLALIHDKLRFAYVPDPNNTGVFYVLDPQDIYDGTYSEEKAGDFWKNQDMEIAQDLMKNLVRDPAEEGDTLLQQITDQILQMEGGKVVVLLVDDNTRLKDELKDKLFENYGAGCRDTEDRIWPCTWMDDRNDKKIVYIPMGGRNMHIYGYDWAYAYFVHGLMHSRYHPDMGAHVFYPFNEDFNYPRDSDELMLNAYPNIKHAYWESVANMAAYLYDPQLLAYTFDWFAQNGALEVEVERSNHAQQIDSSAWLYNHLKVESPGNGAVDAFGRTRYHIRELPPRFIIQNEAIMGMLLTQWSRQFGMDKLFNIIDRNTLEAIKVQGYYTGTLLDILCENTSETSEGLSHLLPLAYADYLTNFGTVNSKEFSDLFEGELSNYWIDQYFSYARSTIKFEMEMERSGFSQNDFNVIAELLKAQSSEFSGLEGSE